MRGLHPIIPRADLFLEDDEAASNARSRIGKFPLKDANGASPTVFIFCVGG